MKRLYALLIDEKGQGMTEYGLVLGVLSLAAFALIAALRTEIGEMYQSVINAVTSRENGGLTSSISTDQTN